MSDRLRLGIIGFGVHAIEYYVPEIQSTERAELVAISRRDPEALAQAKEALGVSEAYTDWHDLLDHAHVDAVIVTTSHASHAAPTIAALEMGLPVLVEKPMAFTSQDAWAMVRAAERADRPLMVAYQHWHCSGLWRTAKRLLREGAIGTLEQVGVTYSVYFRWLVELRSIPSAFAEQAFQVIRQQMRTLGVPAFVPVRSTDYWRTDRAQMGGGMFVECGTHFCDLALWLGGAPATTVVALSEPKGKAAERYLTATARLANGVIASVMGNDGTDVRSQLTVIGDRGALTGEWTGFEGTPELWLQREGKRERVVSEYEDQTRVAAFVATVLDGTPNLSPGRDAAHVVEFTEAAYRSALEERLVTIESTGAPGAVAGSPEA